MVCSHNLRYERALRALLQSPLRREQLDRVATVSNGPDLIRKLRRRLSLELPCKLVPLLDKDGRTVVVGEYSLTDADKRIARRWLETLPKQKLSARLGLLVSNIARRTKQAVA